MNGDKIHYLIDYNYEKRSINTNAMSRLPGYPRMEFQEGFLVDESTISVVGNKSPGAMKE